MSTETLHKPSEKSPRIMIIAGEASGDLHGGRLAKALLSQNRPIELIGFGGTAMQQAGVDIRYDIKKLGIVGLIEILFHLRVIWEAYRYAISLLKSQVALLVLIDFSGFNLRVAKAAKKMGIPVVYYVSPQVWAWRSGRVQTIAKYVDQMIVILPFEKAIYDKAHVPCEFVGHPLLDELSEIKKADKNIKRNNNEKTPTIALLPGSRKREVLSLLPAMLAALERIQEEFPGLQVLIPVASSLPTELILELTTASPLPITLIKGSVYDVLFQADVAIIASGTATLQGALANIPMVIVYKISRISYILARYLIQIQSMSLANIVADKPFIPELVQENVSATRISSEIRHLLTDKDAYKKMKQNLSEVSSRLGSPGASNRAAKIIYRLLDKQSRPAAPSGQYS
ncbi:Lipid-A-disaccharide synthase [hydrothermal vent metagenome]|uniref:lipid-A-disaccharide synthase n=1 Tax=hydrothermal vent metagenome TaxID=652676 RepID=A0A3B1D9X3_9ZZZZ